MNLWARYDEEDRDMVHFSAQYRAFSINHRRLLATIHIDDLPLFFEEEDASMLRERLEDNGKVFLDIKLKVVNDDEPET